MGIAFITAKAEKFKGRRDKAYEEQLESENLFSGIPEIVARTYRCKATAGELPVTGTMVLLYSSGETVLVLHLNQEVGTVMSPDMSEIKEVMERAHTDMLPARVVEVRPLSGIFCVQLQLSST